MAHGVVECPVGGDSAASANTSFFGPIIRICGTLCLMQSFRISRAAQLLGVSDDTVRRWVDQGLLPTTDAIPAEIPGDALAARAVALAEEAQESNHALSSARNRFVGIVTRVQIDGVMAQVDLQSGPHRVVSLMSAEAARELHLEVGSLAAASVKATNVVVEVPRG
ncbi:TOBE domain protein [Microbacterium foliorum]|uniref:TOBE domain protein n=2 Tax=Microbacterium foliorum TaxID=104336 RepID=A0A0F0KLS9_9MICO|nr:TOBE domain protein [Microbacterium foliorum]